LAAELALPVNAASIPARIVLGRARVGDLDLQTLKQAIKLKGKR
jgi:hypothetical protein